MYHISETRKASNDICATLFIKIFVDFQYFRPHKMHYLAIIYIYIYLNLPLSNNLLHKQQIMLQ